MPHAEPETLWTPSSERVAASRIRAYMEWLRDERGLDFDRYQTLWQWSVDDLEAFWSSLADFFEIRWRRSPEAVLGARGMPGAEWFPGGELNWAEHLLRGPDADVAIVYRSESGTRSATTFAELRDRVARTRRGLERLGVGHGDRVVGYLGNSPEAVTALLASASLGAIWSSCPPEFGVSAVLDRFRQIEPKVLLAHDGYPYNGRLYDRSGEIEAIRSELDTLEASVLSSRLGRSPDGWLDWAELESEAGELTFDAVPFDHPLWILYSSGTTGLPKAIVQGHGGILLEHLKQLALSSDLGPRDTFFWYSTTGWMMWNYLVSGLAVGSTIVLWEGAPAHPDLGALFRMADEERVTYFGTSAPFLVACRKAGLRLDDFELEALRSVGSTGAPLPEEGFEWVYDSLKRDVALGSVSGGTDVCTAFVGSCPLRPVRKGELQSIALGFAVAAFNEAGEPVLDEVGELVVTEPAPSMPVSFWGDPEGERYRGSYFDTYPGVWRHGDWIRLDELGRSVIFGRSDSTLNRGGVRMGTSDFYRVVDTFPEIVDSLVIDTGTLGDAGELWLFVVMASDCELDHDFAERLRSRLRQDLSPRHVPDEIRAVPDVPKTLSGKKLEVPIRKILAGVPEDEALNRGTLANPESIGALLAAARG